MSVPSPRVFRIDFSCIGMNRDRCDRAEELLNELAMEVANQFVFSTPINVTAKFAPMIPDEGEFLMGRAQPTMYFASRRDNGPLLMYPKALVKQSDVPVPEALNGYDIEMAFNSEIDWSFDDDSTVGVGDGKFSFDCKIATN